MDNHYNLINYLYFIVLFSICVSQNNTHLILMNYDSALMIFGIKQAPDKNSLSKLYKSLSKKRHPDAGGTNKSFNDLVEAYKTLQKPRPVPYKKPQEKEYKRAYSQKDVESQNEYEKKVVKQDFSWIQSLTFWFMVIFLRYKPTKFNNEIFLKTNKGKFIYIANKKTNINNNYLKLNKKYIKITKTDDKFIKINELIFILFI